MNLIWEIKFGDVIDIFVKKRLRMKMKDGVKLFNN